MIFLSYFLGKLIKATGGAPTSQQPCTYTWVKIYVLDHNILY